MRILFLTPGFPPLRGGGERYAYRLGQQLVRHGHQVTVVTSQAQRLADFYKGSEKGSPTREPQEGMQIIRLPIRPLKGGRVALLAWRKAMIFLSTVRGPRVENLLQHMAAYIPPITGLEECLATLGAFDLVHTFNLSWESSALAGWRYARKRGLPHVVTPFFHIGRGLGSRVALNMTMHHQRRLLHEADAILTLTPIESAALEALGVEASRLYCVGSGTDDLPPPQALCAAHLEIEKLGLPRPFALFIGRLERDKGAILAVEAVRRANQHMPHLGLVLIGERTPPFDRYWRAFPSGERHQIRPLGSVSEVLKHALLQECAMLLLPSEVESFGLVILEAWSHRKPVIAARAGGIPGVVRDGETGLLVPPRDAHALSQAILRLLKEPALARRLSEMGHSMLGIFTWERIFERVTAAYHTALARKG